MPLLIDVATAARELHVALLPGEEADMERKLNAAAELAQAFLGRNVYASQEELDAAAAAAPAALAAAASAYDDALLLALGLPTRIEREQAASIARGTRNDAEDAYRRAVRGLVLSDSVRTAILLTAGGLWEHRGDESAVPGMPAAAQAFLGPLRIGLSI